MKNRTQFLISCIVFLILISSPGQLSSEPHKSGETYQTNSVSVGGVTFLFNRDYTVGTYANGDYWVLGPVTITAITPEFDGQNNGWEINPIVDGGQGFQSGCSGDGFDPTLVPLLPYLADPVNGILSIVKTTPTGNARPCIKEAAVLTVVSEIPPGNGAQVFRPPYVGTEKPYYYVSHLRTDLLPEYVPVDNMPALESVAETFNRLRLDHKRGVLGRSLRPQESMRDYQPANTGHQSDIVLRLMMNDPVEEKMPALINFVQFGIDKIHMIYLGQTWPAGGGHQPGHKLVVAFAAVMLDIQEAKETLQNATFFHGSDLLSWGEGIKGLSLWGQQNSEWAYWNYIINDAGNRSNKDPYGYIDGGRASDASYQHITVQAHKGEMLATHLMPILKEAWNMEEWAMAQNYVDRWVYFGKWSQPDPYAPFDGNAGNYGATYGPTEDTGLPITGYGRYPLHHGTLRDEGQYRSRFVESMWNTYRTTALGAESTPPFAAIIYPRNGDYVAGQVNLSATAFGIHEVDWVQYKLNGNNIGERINNPTDSPPNTYGIIWDADSYSGETALITALVTDRLGNTYESAPIEIIMDPDGSNQSGEFNFRVYPNPFSNYFNVDFFAPNAGRYEITLHDIKGRKIDTLLDQELPQGFYNFRLDGIKLPAGVYICTLRSKKRNVTVKVIRLTIN